MIDIEEITQEFKDIAQDIQEEKETKAQHTGALNAQLKILKELKIKSESEAKKKVLSLEKKLEKLDAEIETKYNELKEIYEW